MPCLMLSKSDLAGRLGTQTIWVNVAFDILTRLLGVWVCRLARKPSLYTCRNVCFCGGQELATRQVLRQASVLAKSLVSRYQLPESAFYEGGQSQGLTCLDTRYYTS